MVSTTRKLLEKIRSTAALGIMCRSVPDTLVAVRKDCPLLIGLGKAKTISHRYSRPVGIHRDYYLLETNEIAVLKNECKAVYDRRQGSEKFIMSHGISRRQKRVAMITS